MCAINVNFGGVPDSQDFSPIEIGKHPARVTVDAYQKDQQGNIMTGPDGQPAMRKTQAGDTMWNLEWHVLDVGPDRRPIFDNLNFTQGGLRRVKVMYVRAGLADGTEESIDLEPEDLNGTYWWIDVEHPDPAEGLKEGASLKAAKYPFKPGKCTCSTCLKYAGKHVNVYARVGFAGMELMSAADAQRYRPGARNGASTTAGACAECMEGKHWHKAGICPCEESSHPPF